MIQHYFKIAIRNLLKYKTQTAISIIGLAIGLAFFMFGLHWLRYETSYDSFYPKANRTYMVYQSIEGANEGIAPPVLADFIYENCPEVEYVTRSFNDSGLNYAFDDKVIKSPEFVYVDSSFVQLFPQKILYGRTIQHDNEIIISETFARKHWDNPVNAIGTTLKQQASQGMYLSNPLQLSIVGVIADAPNNSLFQYSGYIQQTFERRNTNDEKEWQFANATIHVALRENIGHEDFTKHLSSLLSHKEYLKETKFKVISLSEKHFEFASEESFSYSSIRMFAAASLLLLCCVAFNFLNLFLNRYYQRSREMKLRKSVGANTIALIKQLMIEMLLYCIIAFLLCGCLLEFFIPFFEQTFDILIQRYEMWTEYLLVVSAALVLMGFILLLPVLQFISASTTRSLLDKPRTHRHHLFRRISLAIQLIICLFFFASTLILYQQLNFMRHTDLGFGTNNLIELFINPREQNGRDMLEEIKRLPMIQNWTSTSDYIISKNVRSLDNTIEWEGKTDEDKKIQIAKLEVGKNGDKIFNFRLIEGRNFSDNDWTSNESQVKDAIGYSILNKVLINEKMAKTMRMSHPIGRVIRIPFGMYKEGGLKLYYYDYEIIGLVKDFHSQGMKYAVYPTVITQSFRFLQPLNYFQTVAGTETNAIVAINELAQKFQWEYNQENSEPRTVTSKLQELSKSENATYRLFSLLALICILISLFGIYSISSSTIEQRRKEIAVRKVMGASVGEIIRLFFREYILLVCISAVIAFPVVYYVMSQWLEQYVYRISIEITIFLFILGIIILLVCLTVLQQVLKAANENPSEVIKAE